MISTVTTKGQVTIPKAIRDVLHIQPHDKVDFIQEGDRVVLVPVKTMKDLRGSVRAVGNGDFDQERAKAKIAVAGRITGEME